MPYPHGLFSWADVSAPHPIPASKFYSELFGWDADDQHDDGGAYVYTMFRKDGKDVAGLGGQPPGFGDDVPARWNSYINVDHLDETIENWASSGGSVVMPAMDVMTSGRMAFVADPEGAVVALWEPEDHIGAEVFGEAGTMSWNELATRDSDAARAFYGEVLGWEFEKSSATPSEYWLINLHSKEPGQAYAEDEFNGGIISMTEDWGETSAHWMVYFTVDDTDATVEKLKDLGGEVAVAPFDSDVGRMSIVRDPQGAAFTVIAPPAG